MTSTRAILLHSDSLSSKWGFNDGDEPSDFLDWLDDHTEGGNAYVSIDTWQTALRTMMRTYLAPLLPNDVKLIDIDTSHNPIRADSISGEDVDWYEGPPKVTPPVQVEVPFEDVRRLVQP
jgi:hypothetical protein